MYLVIEQMKGSLTMIYSMTGFGRCETEQNGREISVEIKSVNHRYFEFSCRTPRAYSFLDDKLKSYVSSRVSRGKIDMYVSVGTEGDTASEVTVNHQLMAGYLAAMKEISETLYPDYHSSRRDRVVPVPRCVHGAQGRRG